MPERARLRRLAVDLLATAPQWALTEDGAEELRRAAPSGWDVEIVRAPTVSDGDGGAAPSAEALAAIHDAEVYFGFGISRPLYAAARRLRWVHSAAAGVGGLLFPEMRESDVLVTNSAGVHAVPIAEYVVGGVLYLLRQFDVAVAQQRIRRWDKQPFVGSESRVRELGDARALIVGAGGIGRAVAERLTALGARCTGIRRHPERGTPAGFAAVAGPAELDALLPSHDLLVIAAPATTETRELVTVSRLDRLPSGTIVVNVARGSLVDEVALAERVASGRLRGAVLDVFREEPLPPESPLWTLPSVLMTPHVSAVSPHGFWRRELALFIDNWHRYVAGQPLRNVVDKHAGY
jgi:phosphoglycerate dehydrogenase-like enzyme